VGGNDSGEVVAVRDNPDSVVRMGTPVQVVADIYHIVVVVVLHMQVLVEALMGHRLVELMVRFDLVMVVHLESAPVSGMVHQLIEVKKSNITVCTLVRILNDSQNGASLGKIQLF